MIEIQTDNHYLPSTQFLSLARPQPASWIIRSAYLINDEETMKDQGAMIEFVYQIIISFVLNKILSNFFNLIRCFNYFGDDSRWFALL